MLFNSLHFALFLPIVFFLFWSFPPKQRWIVLLISSYYFYMCWNAVYVLLILFSTVISYGAARIITETTSALVKKTCLFTTLVVCFGILFVYKYFNFFIGSFISLLTTIGFSVHSVTVELLLPVGISFYTFQTLSYVIDVYRNETPVEENLFKYATFVAFFPQLVAGPIERSNNLLPQITRTHSFSYENATYGLKLMAWGFFKKIVVADTMAHYVDLVYGNLPAYTGFPLLFSIFAFAIQIYCDFSGYSDIAIGTAKLFDIHLMRNFSSPYFSTSIKEFWSRWHISLSTWFRDYLYIPLGGNRCSKLRNSLNLIITFAVSGLWHGANWTYIIWGFSHGIAQVTEKLTSASSPCARKNKPIATKLPSGVLVFLFCCATWVVFRAPSMKDAVYVFSNLFHGIGNPVIYLTAGMAKLEIGTQATTFLAIMIAILSVFDFFNKKQDVIMVISKWNAALRWCVYLVFIFLILVLLPENGSGEFIYFQF